MLQTLERRRKYFGIILSDEQTFIWMFLRSVIEMDRLVGKEISNIYLEAV